MVWQGCDRPTCQIDRDQILLSRDQDLRGSLGNMMMQVCSALSMFCA